MLGSVPTFCGILPAADAKILIAEDHLLNQAYMKKLLPQLGIPHFTIVENGIAATEAVIEGDFDLVLMDCHMPHRSGYEATQAIREHEQKTQKHIPIIAMTANAMLGEREKCMSVGMDEYMSKPIDRTQFIRILERWIKFPSHIKSSAPAGSINSRLNLEHLRSFTGGDLETEREFTLIFFEQSKLQLASLGRHCVNGVSEAWKESAHSLKGGAANMGAEKMKDLCSHAQDMLDASENDRKAMHQAITEEFARVCADLKTMHLLKEGALL